MRNYEHVSHDAQRYVKAELSIGTVGAYLVELKW